MALFNFFGSWSIGRIRSADRPLPAPAAVTSTLVLLLLGGCAVSISSGGTGERLLGGLLHVARASNGRTAVVQVRTAGTEIRFSKDDGGATLGYSSCTRVLPMQRATYKPVSGLRWPLGVAWTDEEHGVFHELGWIVTRVPEPGDASLTHRTQIGLGGTFSNHRVGVMLGYSDRVDVRAPPDRDALYMVRYRSDRPFDSLFLVDPGDD